MISLNCTSCQKTLEIDDAFAGGVCRCRYCGTIQTVPVALKSAAKPPAPKTLYQKKQRAPGQPGTGLEGLSDAVTSSSGLARGALRRGNPNRAARPEPPPPPPQKKNLLPLFVAISAALLLAVIVLFILLLQR